MTIVIPIKPITKKNSMQIITNHRTGRPMVIPSKRYREYEKACEPFLKGYQMGIDRPVNVTMVFYIDRDGRVDLGNLQSACLDILVKYGVIADDNFKIVQTMDDSRVFIDRKNPRTEITIYGKEETL